MTRAPALEPDWAWHEPCYRAPHETSRQGWSGSVDRRHSRLGVDRRSDGHAWDAGGHRRDVIRLRASPGDRLAVRALVRAVHGDPYLRREHGRRRVERRRDLSPP